MTEPKLLPQTFQAQTDSIASYNYTDIAEGTGVSKFYFFYSETDAGEDHHLSTQVYNSTVIEKDFIAPNEANFQKQGDVDFDLSEFNKPKYIKGTAILNGTIALYILAARTGEGYIKVRLRKWDGSTETEIASEDSQTLTSDSNEVVTIPITVPLTHFEKGDTLRVTIEYWIKGDGGAGGSCYLYFGHDPAGRDGTRIVPSTTPATDITASFIEIPFRFMELGY